jgi:nucleotide-binding universal stress UspA family protein
MASTVAIRRILFPTDFSAYSAVAGRAAADLARQFGARLHVLHVVPPVTDPTPAPAALRSVKGELGAGLTIDTHVSSGVPARQIVTYARRAGIDLIVMGRHGRTGVSGLLLGSVAEAVARRAPCWVLIVPVGLPEREAAAPEEEEEEVATSCLVCGQSATDLVCENCRARIRGEALERKRRDERGGRQI